MSFNEQLYDFCDTLVEEYIKTISKKYNIPEKELISLWKEPIEATKSKTESKTESKPESKAESKPESKVKTTTFVINNATCSYVFSRGARSGERCDCRAMQGISFCSKHKDKEKKCEKVKKKTESSILRKHAVVGKFWHADTSLVFRSAEDKTVVGKIVNNVIVDLSEEDIMVCKRMNFKYQIVEKEEECLQDKVINKITAVPSMVRDCKTVKKSVAEVIAGGTQHQEATRDVCEILKTLQGRESDDELDYKGDENSLEDELEEEEEDYLLEEEEDD